MRKDLASIETLDTTVIAKAADRLHQINSSLPPPRTAAVHAVGTNENPIAAAFLSIHKEVAAIQESNRLLKEQVDKMERLSRERPRLQDDEKRPDTPRPRSRHRSPAQKRTTYRGLCWYHFKFGDNATKCNESPCQMADSFQPRETRSGGGCCAPTS